MYGGGMGYFEPDHAAAMGLLTHLNADELKELLNDDTKLEDTIKDLNQFKRFETEKEMLMASNKSLAEFNLAKEPQLNQGKERLMELSIQGEELCRSIEGKMAEMKKHVGMTSLDTMLALLQTAAAEAEEQTEEIGEKFLAGDLEVDEFLEKFAVSRKLMHFRKVKAEKMSELMSRRTSMSSQNSTPTNFYQNFASPPPASPAPYPMMPTSMPMPMPYQSQFGYPNF